MSILINGMKMPKDCPMCPMAHYDTLNHFRGCEVVAGKRHAINDPEYANTSTRPDWCPLIELSPHGRLGDLELVCYQLEKQETIDGQPRAIRRARRIVAAAPTILEAEGIADEQN